MNLKNDLKVIINGKTYTISGYESEEYLQKIARFINNKYEAFQSTDAFRHLNTELRNILMQINLADEYYKLVEQKEELERQLEEKNKEIFDLKHELISKKEEERKSREPKPQNPTT